jgi:hypothetical protein
MRDGDVRAALHTRLQAEHPDRTTTRLLNELDLCGAVRVDVAMINGTLSGYELKSDRDTLRRLDNQVRVYSQVLDHATLVVGEKHYSHAITAIPDWWGVIVATQAEQATVLVESRPSSINGLVDPFMLVQLLWRDETLDELATRGLDRGLRSKPRMALWEALASGVPLEELRHVVRERLKHREGWRSP